MAGQAFTVCPIYTQKGKKIAVGESAIGAAGRTQTDDLLVTNQPLYQLSYGSRFGGDGGI